MLHLEGHVLGGCKLIRKVGEGGMGAVYLAEQMRMGNRLVAVKVVRAGDATSQPSVVEDTERRFRREAALIGQFSHPNILPVHDAGVEAGILYLVMQYAPDGSLADALRPTGRHPLRLPADPAFARDVLTQVASALQYTHDHNVVHRDVKPGNILLRIERDGRWHVLLADFGIARAAGTSSERTQVTGTFAYMAPEQFSGHFSPASDQYALAVVAYQLLTGRPPFEGTMVEVMHGHITQAPPTMRSINPNVPPQMEAAVLRALSKDPAKRFPSVTDFARALGGEAPAMLPPPLEATTRPADEALATGLTQPIPLERTAPLPVKARRPRLWRAFVTLLAAVLLVAAILGGTDLLAQQQARTQAEATRTAEQTQVAGQQTATAVAGTAVAATATAAMQVPVATATAGISTPVTAPPPPPAGLGAAIFSDPSPMCDSPPGPLWERANATQTACVTSGKGVTVTAQDANQLGCIQYPPLRVADGYLSALVTPGTRGAVLGFRQGSGPSSGTSIRLVGYYVRVTPATSQYTFYRVTETGQGIILQSGTLPGALPATFAFGVRFQGPQVTAYINGQSVATASDSTITDGWTALCTEGSTTYRDVQIYRAGA